MKFIEAVQRQIDKNPTVPYKRTAEDHTMGDLMHAIFAIKTDADAKEFYETYIEWMASRPDLKSEHTPQQIVDSNIGWCFGEGMPQKQIDMWQRVSSASHPVFGKTVPSAESLLKSGALKALFGEPKSLRKRRR